MSGIAELLYKIKEGVGALENGAADKARLDGLKADFSEFFELVKLFLISERDSYYGFFLMNLRLDVDFAADCLAGIRLRDFPPVLVANPMLLCKLTLREILYVICHEIDHVLLNHPTEMLKANPDNDPDVAYRFNLAADAAVNDRIDCEIEKEKRTFLAAPDGVITSRVLARMLKVDVAPLESYAYYFALLSDAGVKKPKDAGNGQERVLRRAVRGDAAPASSGSGEGVVSAQGCTGLCDHAWDAGDDAEDAAAAARELVNAAVGMMNDETHGMVSGFFHTQVEKLNAPPQISWQSVLKKYVGTLAANKKKTRMRLNRRQPERFDLSGTVDDKLLKLVVAIDTSASVEDDMIARIFNELFAILAKRRHEITVIECDAEVRRVYKARTPGDVKTSLVGRGGTLFSPVIEYVNNDPYFRDALLIYFTDGFGEAEIPKPRTYRSMWVVFDDARHLSLKEPHGVVLTL